MTVTRPGNARVAEGCICLHTGVMPETPEDLLTVSEAARLIQMSPDTIRRYSDAGTLVSVRTPARHRRFRRADVLALLSSESAGRAS